jgi:hypothetical protein
VQKCFLEVTKGRKTAKALGKVNNTLFGFPKTRFLFDLFKCSQTLTFVAFGNCIFFPRV